MTMAIDFDAIRRDHPLEGVVAQVVKLRRSGVNKVGQCPFHPDRSPSFVLYPDSYHCFGCGAHGDVIDFVAGTQNIGAADAIRFLTGNETPRLDDADTQRRLDEARQRETAHRKMQENATLEARERWARATPINGKGNAYLERKGVAPHGTRCEGDNLLVPIFDDAGLIQSVQLIPAEEGARKLFHAGAPVAGGTFTLGDAAEGPVVVVEGFATGATVHAATGFLVIVGFSKGALKRTAQLARARYPGRPVIIGADANGIDTAHDAAEAVGGRVIVPDLQGADGSDFNDQAAHYGLEDVAQLFIEPSAPQTPLPLIWAKDVEPILSGNWIVKRVIPRDGFVSIIGEPGCGKSFFALDLGCRIAAGLAWRDRKVEPGLVVYLAAEGQRGQMNRIEAWKRENGVDDMPLALIPVAINLRDSQADLPKLITTIEAAVALTGLSLSVLFVDTLNRSFGGGDENGEDMGQYVGNADHLRQHFGCTTCHIHHIPKNGDLTERGHGSLRGAIDTSLGVSVDAETGLRTLICLKQKDGEDGWRETFRLKRIVLGEDEDGDEVSTCVIDQANDEAPVQRSRGPNLSATQRQVYNELLATMEAAPVGIPRDIPEDRIDRSKIGKVCERKTWRDRWIAVAGPDYAKDTADRAFRRAATDLVNKGLVATWNDHAWPTFQ